MDIIAGNITVKGRLLDNYTRCAHYHGPTDIVAIKFSCCEQYYACYYCHLEEAEHPAVVWKKTAFDTKAILCGACTREMTITEYRSAGHQCTFCKSPFNPKCINHDHFYFEV